MIKSKPCIVDGCEYPRFAKGYCTSHQNLRTDKKPKFKKVKQIAKISARRKTERQIYSVKRRMFLKEKTCEFPNCNKKHTEENQLTIHHKKGTNNGRLLDEQYFMAVCLEHHQYIEEHREESFEKGWLIKRNGK